MSALVLAMLAYCPSYTLSSSANTHQCGVEAIAGTNPTVAQWQTIFDTVSKGPAAWGSNGPAISNIGSGCSKPTPPTTVPARFPCELLKAIAMQESSWKQFCVPDRPADQAFPPERTLIAFDCGYGVGQVTSGMHVGENPAFDRTRVASDALYNLAAGTQILADKWRATRCVGDNLPGIVEHWYSAAWAYNGLSASNNPNNPNFSSTRGVYNPSVGGDAPYQEHVWGWMEFPPTSAHWVSVAVAYPALTDIGTGSSPLTLPEPACASPTDCVNHRAAHRSACLGETDAGITVDAGTSVDAGTLPSSDGGNGDGLDGHVKAADGTLGPAGCACSNAEPIGIAAFLILWGLGRNRVKKV